MPKELAGQRHAETIVNAMTKEDRNDFSVRSEILAERLNKLGLPDVQPELTISASAAGQHHTVFIFWNNPSTGRASLATANIRVTPEGAVISGVHDEYNSHRHVVREGLVATTTIMRLAARAVTAARNSA